MWGESGLCQLSSPSPQPIMIPFFWAGSTHSGPDRQIWRTALSLSLHSSLHFSSSPLPSLHSPPQPSPPPSTFPQPPPLLPLFPTAPIPSLELADNDKTSIHKNAPILGFIPWFLPNTLSHPLVPLPWYAIAQPSAFSPRAESPSTCYPPLPAGGHRAPCPGLAVSSAFGISRLQPAGSLPWGGETLFLALGQMLSKTKVQGRSLFPWSAGDSH